MKPEDTAGRVPKEALIISQSVMLALCVVAVTTRFIIRFRVQKQSFSADDGFLLLAFSLLLCSVVVMFKEVMNRMYLIVALQTGVPGVIPPPDWMQISFHFHKWVTVCGMVAWASVVAVKLSFLFFFKKLIDRVPVLNYYWWVVVLFNLACLGYGTAIWYIGCPYYFDPRELQCATGRFKKLLVHHSTAQMVLDLVGDAMILAIPICIIWQIKVQWTQKVALASSLCLTVIMMATTVARLAGLINNDMVDTIWELYWTVVSAQVGVFLAAATAFRSFFVSRKNSKALTPKEQAQRFFSASFAAKFNRKRKDTLLDDTLESGTEKGPLGLPAVPRAQMTGLRTFINDQGEIQSIQVNSPESTLYSKEEDSARLHSSASSKEPVVVIRDV
ncbi:hypothetical protein GGP41_003316 [Bipolaris sorokiniana]|uniref:Rhodopsin domain-containing protein n=2 Tax=Cochliobolus sativus TaxID=45130 RepID=A0A8H6DUL6_COCSA|nr:uncharacterized protein COCSADRAFT_134240 [Bipolaris sorokiniana ND90Pr]EMD68471.1 hypothetical protein COCSADRAFT_134240 [Bipolaris sorokiniana ND90Pr]KAF5847050.1 hypothetical protein GGP41_003316 [Bipolaris sorokiniana]